MSKEANHKTTRYISMREIILYRNYINLLRDKVRYFKKITDVYCDIFVEKNSIG